MIVSLDIGASKVALGLVSDDEELVHSRRHATPAGLAAKPFLKFLEKEIELMLAKMPPEQTLQAVGIGSCGIVSEGAVNYSPNTAWRSLPLAEVFSDRFQVPVAVLNDADAFALGVYHYEFAGRFQSLGVLTLGSGIGGAFVGPDGVFGGYSGISPEVGHTILHAEGRLCSCGRRGCLEAYANLRVLLEDYRRNGGESSVENGHALYRRFQQGDRAAATAFARYGSSLGIAIASLFHLFSPQAFVLGGGLSRASRAFLPDLTEAVNEHLLTGFRQRPQVVISRQKEKASLLGAAFAASEQERAMVY